MAVFSDRHNGYKLGVLLLFASCVMAVWGVVAPGWLKVKYPSRQLSVYTDLWFTNCHGGFSNCDFTDFNHRSDAFYATLALTCLGLLLLLCSCALAIHRNWCKTVMSYDAAVHSLTVLSGIALFVACMVYVGEFSNEVLDASAFQYGASFILTLTASIFTFVAAILIGVYNKRTGAYYASTALLGSTVYPVSYQSGQEISGNAFYGSGRGEGGGVGGPDVMVTSSSSYHVDDGVLATKQV